MPRASSTSIRNRDETGFIVQVMMPFSNPALEAFVAAIGSGMAWAQVWIRPLGDGGHDLRHIADREQTDAALRRVDPEEVRALAQFNASGAYRPIKAAPDLVDGWRVVVQNAGQLDMVVDQLYPGSVPDWFEVMQGDPTATHFEDLARRQTGIYGVLRTLDGHRVALVANACCHASLCLKHRRWIASRAEPPSPGSAPSLIPCLEPCALLMDLARDAARMGQEETVMLRLTRSEIERIIDTLEAASHGGLSPGQAPVVIEPVARRRLRLLLETIRTMILANSVSASDRPE